MKRSCRSNRILSREVWRTCWRSLCQCPKSVTSIASMSADVFCCFPMFFVGVDELIFLCTACNLDNVRASSSRGGLSFCVLCLCWDTRVRCDKITLKHLFVGNVAPYSIKHIILHRTTESNIFPFYNGTRRMNLSTDMTSCSNRSYWAPQSQWR